MGRAGTARDFHMRRNVTPQQLRLRQGCRQAQTIKTTLAGRRHLERIGGSRQRPRDEIARLLQLSGLADPFDQQHPALILGRQLVRLGNRCACLGGQLEIE